MTAMDNQAPVGLAIQQLWKLKVAGRITEEQFIDMTVDVWRFLERLRLRPAQRRAALNVVPHVVSTGPKCWNMLDVVCSLKCCFNMWNILGGPQVGTTYRDFRVAWSVDLDRGRRVGLGWGSLLRLSKIAGVWGARHEVPPGAN